MYKLKLLWLALSKKIWPKVTAFAFIGIFCALSAYFFKGYIPDDFSEAVGAEAAVNILTILASSMLAVTTFSLSTMVAAYGSATSSASPRATALITEDKATQNALAVFLGAFVFSLVGLIALNMGIYEGGGRFILFISTLSVIVLIIVLFIRWIDRLTTLGRVGETSRLVELAAKAITVRAGRPTLGCNKLKHRRAGEAAAVVKAAAHGYLRFVDIKDLATLADKHDMHVYVTAMPGDYVSVGDALCRVAPGCPEEAEARLRSCFSLGEQREFEQDPRFGIIVLAEIGSRAASEAVRDNGTAIDVITRLTHVLETYITERCEDEIEFARVWVPELSAGDLFRDAFNAIAREGAPMYEVHLRLQKSLARLYELDDEGYRAAALKCSAVCLAYSDNRLVLQEEKDRLHAAAIAATAAPAL